MTVWYLTKMRGRTHVLGMGHDGHLTGLKRFTIVSQSRRVTVGHLGRLDGTRGPVLRVGTMRI